jgi:O-antigen ligase
LTELNPVKAKFTFTALVVVLAVVFLSLYEAGFDHNVVYPVAIALLIFIILISLFNKELKSVELNPGSPAFFLLLFFLWSAASFFWSVNQHRTLVELIQLTIYLALFYLAIFITQEEQFRVGRLLFILGSAIALFGISQFMLLESTRIYSTFSNPNPFGIFLVMLYLCGWSYYLRQPDRILAAACLIFLIALALTGSRGSYICLFLSLPVLLIGLDKKQWGKAALKTVASVVLALLITQGITHVAPYLQDIAGKSTNLQYFLTRPENFIAHSGLARFNYWLTGFRIFTSNPVSGYGLGTFFLAYFAEYDGGRWYSRFAHNHYIQIMAELGIVGISLFAGFVLSSAKAAYNRLKKGEFPPYYPGLAAAVLAFLINMGADFSFNFPAAGATFIVIFALLLGPSALSSGSTKKVQLPKMALIGFSLILLLLTTWQFIPTILYRQGIVLDARGELAEAVAVYNEANRIYPINSMAYAFAGNNYYQLYRESGDVTLMQQAILNAEKAVELSPLDGNLHNRLGRLYFEAGHTDKAEMHLKLGVRYAAYRLPQFIDLAWFYLQMERFAEAEEIIEQALALEESARLSARSNEDREKVDAQVELLLQLKQLKN